MPSPRADDAKIEYQFADAELLAARILDPLKIMWLQTRYSQIWKQKASMLVPEEMTLDRSYIMKICELEGKLNLIQELLDDHKTALGEFNKLKLEAGGDQPVSEVNKGAGDITRIAHSAGVRVHTG